MTDLHDLARRIMSAETPEQGEQILREAIEQLIGEDEKFTQFDPLPKMYRNQLRHELLASIKPKGDK